MTQSIPLSLSRGYVSSWTVEDAIREVAQNTFDQGNYETEVGEDSLVFTTYGNTISRDMLLLGNGTKTYDSSKRGAFCEGLKVALLVLTREEISIVIENGDVVWTPYFSYSDTYGCECLHIGVSSLPNPPCVPTVKITISGLNQEEIDNFVDNTLQMQDTYDTYETPLGDILLDEQHKGKIFVGGLFINAYKSDYGFDFKPSVFKLDRDRHALNPFDIEWQTRTMWDEMSSSDDSDAADIVLGAVVTNDRSLSYADLNPSIKLKESVEDVYNNKYSGKLVTADHDEYEELRDAGNDVAYVDNEHLVKIIHQTDAYQSFSLSAKTVDKKSIEDLLDEFYERWYDDMSADMCNDFEDMQDKINRQV